MHRGERAYSAAMRANPADDEGRADRAAVEARSSISMGHARADPECLGYTVAYDDIVGPFDCGVTL